MDKNYRHYNKSGSMDSIETPDVDKIKKLNDPQFRGNKENLDVDRLFSNGKYKVQGEFDKATKLYEDPVRLKQQEEEPNPEKDFSDFASMMPEKKADNNKKQLTEQQTARKRVIKWICITVAVLLIFMLIFPPAYSMSLEDSKVDYETDVFKSKGMTGMKAYALANYSVYNEKAFSSEKSENYRLVNLVFTFRNLTPFEAKIPQYEVSGVSSDYKDAVCYATAVKTNADGEVVGDVVPAFGKQTVTVKVLINVTGMDDAKFNDCVTGIMLSTKGMKKKIAKNTYLPCIPAFMPVLDAVEVPLSNK